MDATLPPSEDRARTSSSGNELATGPPRWPYAGHGQQTLLWASVLITVGAFLPWLMTGVGTFTGMRGAGSWTVFAGVIGIGVSLVRSRRIVLAHAIAIAALTIALPTWQLLHTVSLVGFGGWLPGIGLLMTLGGGIVIAGAAREIHAERCVRPRPGRLVPRMAPARGDGVGDRGPGRAPRADRPTRRRRPAPRRP